MAKNDLQSAKQNWAQRIDQARAAGLPDSAFTGLMQRDLTAVNQGKTPMQNKEVIDAMRASAGLSPIKDPSSGHGPLDVLGNISSDIRGIVTGFPGGVVNYVTTLPEQMANLKDLVQQDPQTIHELGMESGSSLSDIGGLLRNMTKVPVLSPLVPGVHTAGALTTEEGRKELESHPVSALIDVGAAASLAGKLGALGTEAGAAETAATREAGTIENPAKRAAAMNEVPRTIKGAIQTGNPYKAFGRAAIKTAESTPRVREHINRSTLRQFAEDFGFHPNLNLARARGEIQTRQELEAQDFMKEHIIKPLKGYSEEDKKIAGRVAQEIGSEEDIARVAEDPRMQAVVIDAKRLQEEAAKADPSQMLVKAPWQRKYVYAKGSPVANKWEKHQKLAKKAVEAEKAMNELEAIAHDKIDRFGGADKSTQLAVNRALEARAHFEKTDKAAGAALKSFHETLGKNAPASFYAKLAEEVRTRAIDVATHNKRLSEAQLAEVTDHIKSSVDMADLASALGKNGPQQVEQIMQEVEQTWTELARNGADPLYLPNVTGSKLNRVYKPSVIPDARYAKAHTSRKTAFNLSRSVQDIAVGLTKTKANALTEAGTREFVDKHIKPYAKTSTQVYADIRASVANGGFSGADVREIIKDEIGRHWVEWNPEQYGLSSHFPSPEGGEMLIPKGIDRSLRYLGFKEHANPFFTAYDRAMNVWRFAVLSTPRHIAHVLLGGLIMGELQDPFFLRDTKSAIDIMRANDPTIISKLGKNVNDFNPEQMLMAGTGHHFGRIMTAVTGSTRWLKNFEDNATLMYKISYMLKKERSGATRDEAMQMANKVFVDANAMTPIERAIFRKVFPFWGFTRHLFRYLMTYPVDHPYRAAILTNLANQHYADWKSGLPQQLQFMFYLGAPDSKGNVSAIDYRSIDPFRSFYNDFTLAGLTQQANPAFQMILQQAGVNVLSATPELYAPSHYDPNTGLMVADRQANPLLAAMEVAVPETAAADALFQMSDQYRNLKTTDPEAFKHRVLTTLGVPFSGGVPETINIPAKIENAQMKRYKDAQTSIGQAIQTGDFSKAKRYASVPVPSSFQRYFGTLQYATPGQIEQIYRALKAQAASQGLGGTSLHALLPKG